MLLISVLTDEYVQLILDAFQKVVKPATDIGGA